MNEYQGEASSGQQNCNGNQTTKSSAKGIISITYLVFTVY